MYLEEKGKFRLSNKELVRNAKSLGLDFEYNKALFWKFSCYTLESLIGLYVEYKTKKLIYSLLNEEEKVKWRQDKEFRHQVLRQARRNFESNRFRDIFKIKTTILGNKHSDLVSTVYENIATHMALDTSYNALQHFEVNGKKIYASLEKDPDIIAKFYFSREQAQSVRNRLRIVRYLFREYALRGKVYSIAAATGQALILAAYDLVKSGFYNFHIVLTDMHKQALERARELAELAEVADKLEYKNISIEDLLKSEIEDNSLDAVEIVGIFEYLPDKMVEDVLVWVFSKIKKGGRIVLSGMNRNIHAKILEKVLNWDICYRSPEETYNLIERSSKDRDFRWSAYMEPWQIHYIFYVEKT